MDTATPETWLLFVGRLHPLVLHVPIGALVLLVGAELWGRRSPARRLEPGMRTFLCAVIAIGTLASAGSGWFLAEEFGSSGDTFWWHRALGISLAVCVTLAAVAASLGRGRTYGLLLAASFLLLLPVGHFGAEMTHGAGFLTEPFASAQVAPSPAPTASPVAVEDEPVPPAQLVPVVSGYESVIAPIFEATCQRCHGPERQKSGLALHDPDLMYLVADSGLAPITPGDPSTSEVLRRMRLDLEHEDHMPPASKPQPSAEQIDAIEAWIAQGASLDAALDFDLAPVAPGEPPAPAAQDATPESGPPEQKPTPPSDAVLEALREEHVHVEQIDPDRQLLWLDFRARPATDAAFVREHVAPFAEFVVDLTLARTAIGDEALAFVASLPRLERLDLSGTSCTSAGIAELRGHAALRSLNLTGTRLDDTVLATLLALPGLERVYLWNSGVTEAGARTLEVGAPELAVQLGELDATQPLAVEPPVQLGNPELATVNALCPVSGEAVSPAFRVVHDGRVIGFCCADCPGVFWQSPDDHPVVAR